MAVTASEGARPDWIFDDGCLSKSSENEFFFPEMAPEILIEEIGKRGNDESERTDQWEETSRKSNVSVNNLEFTPGPQKFSEQEPLPLKRASSPPRMSPASCSICKRLPTKESQDVILNLSGTHVYLNQYKIIEALGKGSFSKVQLAHSTQDDKDYAVKMLSKKKLMKNAGWFSKKGPKRTLSPVDKAYREIAILKKLDHPNVVKLVEVLNDPNADGLYLVFELLERGEVMTLPTDNPLPENQALCYFRDVLLGLEYLHYQKIIHRDIKPQNLLVGNDNHIQIADLGVCTEFEGTDAILSQTAATPAFSPPETLDPDISYYSGKALDIWCLGCTLFAFVFGDLPYGVEFDLLTLYNNIRSLPVTIPEHKLISPRLRDLLYKLLHKDPKKRITMPDIKTHNWVTFEGSYPLPSEEENCKLVEVSEEEIEKVVTSVPKLDTLILVKVMLRNHSFQNPFSTAHAAKKTERNQNTANSK